MSDKTEELLVLLNRLDENNHPNQEEIISTAIKLVHNLSKQSDDSKMLEKAIEFGFEWGGIDGGHHKAWTVDQMLRILCGNKYDLLVAEYKEGEDGKETYNWDCGIAP